jgi:hypothetical protein
MLDLKQRCTHRNAHLFHLIAAGYDTGIVVAQHRHWPIPQIRPKNPLTTYKEVIAVYERKNGFLCHEAPI